MKFTDDEVTTIRSAARIVYDAFLREHAVELTRSRSAVLPEPQEIIETIACNDDIECVLQKQGHNDLAVKFGRLEAPKIVELLEEEFRLN